MRRYFLVREKAGIVDYDYFGIEGKDVIEDMEKIILTDVSRSVTFGIHTVG